MVDEMDLDAWIGPGGEIDLDEPRPSDPPGAVELLGPVVEPDVAAAVARAQADHEQLTMEGPPEPVVDKPVGRAQLRALVYASRSGDDPHVVSIIEDRDGRRAICICKASIFNQPKGCWAMADARVVAGLPEVR